MLTRLILSLSLFSAVLSYCDSKAPTDPDLKVAFESNSEFIQKRNWKGDNSVSCDSLYLLVNYTDFETEYTMEYLQYSNIQVDLKNDTWYTNSLSIVGSDQKLLDAVSYSLGNDPSDIKKNNRYVIYAALDLMNLVYTIEHPRGPKDDGSSKWDFSFDCVDLEVSDTLDKFDIKVVLEFLQQEGVCLTDEYQQNSFACPRYTILSFSYVTQNTNYGLLTELNKGHPVYVEVGIHPMYFQHYVSTNVDFIHAGYIRPSYAGVLTGYDMTTDGQEFWELYIRRHGTYQNKVRLGSFIKDSAGNLTNPFAGITSSARIITIGDGKPISDTYSMTANCYTPSVKTESELRTAAVQCLQFGDPTELNSVTILSLYADLFDWLNLDCSNPIRIRNVFPNLVSLTFLEASDEASISIFMGCVDVSDINNFAISSKITRRLQESEPTVSGTFVMNNLKIVNFKLMSNSMNSMKYDVQITNSNEIETIDLGENSLVWATSFKLYNLTSLIRFIARDNAMGKLLTITDNTLQWDTLPALQIIDVYQNAMDNFDKIKMSNVRYGDESETTSVILEVNARYGFQKYSCKTIDNCHSALINYFDGPNCEGTPSPSPEPEAY